MTREELKKRWVVIVNTVFAAEHALSGVWTERLRKAAESGDEAEKARTAAAYVAAMADEIVSHTTDEEIAEIED